MLDIFFIGEKPIGEWAFAHLIDRASDRLRIVGAVSNADCGAGWWGSRLVMDVAKANGIPFFDSGDIGSDQLSGLISDLRPSTLIVVQGRTIIPGNALRSVDGRAFNLHLAPLPRYRGFYSANHALLEGATEFGATVHWIEPEVDVGGIAFEETVAITPDETAQSLYAKSMQAGMAAFQSLIAALADGETIPCQPQAGSGRFFSRKSLEEHRRIQNISDCDEVDRKARAFHFPGFPVAYFEMGDKRYEISPANPPATAITLDAVASSARRLLAN